MKTDRDTLLFHLKNLADYHPMRQSAYLAVLRMNDLILIDDEKYFGAGKIDADAQLSGLDLCGFEQCAALLTMLLREDYWFDHSFDMRLKQGWPQKIVARMIRLLEESEV